MIIEPDSGKTALNSFVYMYIAYNPFDVINKEFESDLSLVLSLVKLMHFSLFYYNFVYLSLTYITKRYLKYQNIHILLFHLRAIFSEPGSIIFPFCG